MDNETLRAVLSVLVPSNFSQTTLQHQVKSFVKDFKFKQAEKSSSITTVIIQS